MPFRVWYPVVLDAGLSGGDMDRVCLRAVKLPARIGVHAWEQAMTQVLTANVEMRVDVAAAARRDDIEAAVDYAAVAQTLVAVARESRFRLLEALTEALADRVLSDFPVSGVRVEVSKAVKVEAAGTFDAVAVIERGEWS